MEASEEKVQASVQDIADDLIKLYAEREAEKGYAFSADDEMQREFEEAFPYQETEDQLRSISEIKKIWNDRARWIVCWLEMLVTEKPKWLYELLSKRLWMANKSPS